MAPAKRKRVTVAAKNQTVATRTRGRKSKQQVNTDNVIVDELEDARIRVQAQPQDTRNDTGVAPVAPLTNVDGVAGVDGDRLQAMQNLMDIAELERALAAAQGQSHILGVIVMHT